ncbi:hypothetical protein BC826DRAFT_904928 [Russula brevipes]|nr:hypothetical protein BC826DRAFT_904928 [Russula brevipes]
MLVKYIAEKFPDTVNSQGGAYGTPLHAATAKGYLDVVQALLEYDADINAWDRDHRTPSQVAMANGQYVIAQLLSQHRMS